MTPRCRIEKGLSEMKTKLRFLVLCLAIGCGGGSGTDTDGSSGGAGSAGTTSATVCAKADVCCKALPSRLDGGAT
jgi:hypothetical protein